MCLEGINRSQAVPFGQSPNVTVTVQNASGLDEKVATCVFRAFSVLATVAFTCAFLATENILALLGAIGFGIMTLVSFGVDVGSMCSDDSYYYTSPSSVYNVARPIIVPPRTYTAPTYTVPTPVYTPPSPVFSQPVYTTPVRNFGSPSITDTAPIGRQDQVVDQSTPYFGSSISAFDPGDRAQIGRRDDSSSSSTHTFITPSSDIGERAGIGRNN